MMLIPLANRLLLGIGLVVAAGGCAGPRHAEAAASSTAPPPASTPAVASAGCPMMVPGAQSTVADTDGGVAITFTAPADRVDALREAVHRMAERRDAMAGCPCRGMMGDAGAMRGGRGNTMMQQMMNIPPATAHAEDVPGGARLTLTAKNPSDVDALRSRVRMHVEHMKSRGCPMM